MRQIREPLGPLRPRRAYDAVDDRIVHPGRRERAWKGLVTCLYSGRTLRHDGEPGAGRMTADIDEDVNIVLADGLRRFAVRKRAQVAEHVGR